ncbi:transglutaminase domain-containing protein [Lutibacter oricola]|nr:transglutaminase domain-containing protein [Lutibacter oricola]
MRKKIVILIILFSISNFGFAQNQKILSLVEKTNDLNLDMWELTEFAEKNLNDKEQLARFFYYWIGSNIKYDNELYQKIINGTINNDNFWESQEEYKVYDNRKGVCAGYAKLYQWFLDWVDIESVVISGHIRDERNHYINLELDDNYRHAWNAIKINEKWLLVDSTWGTSLDSITADYYFNIDPKKAIITHYPSETKWQLLEKPLTLEEYNKSKFIKPIWFKVGYSDNPNLKRDNKYYYFVFKNNPNKEWIVNLSYSGDNKNFKKIKGLQKIEQDGYTYLRFYKSLIPKKAFFKVNLYKSNNETSVDLAYKDVINFKI